jgi:hypothetical protein
MMLGDPDKMEAAKASFRRQMRFARYALALAFIFGGYYVGKATGQIDRINAHCTAWMSRPGR